MDVLFAFRSEMIRTHPSQIQGEFEHKMGGKYHKEVPGRILRHSFQNTWNTEPRRPQLHRHEMMRTRGYLIHTFYTALVASGLGSR